MSEITIESLVRAPIDRVWLCWTEPEHITQWNFASEDWCCPNAENDLRPGGRYRARMEAKDGSFGFDFEGVYDEVADREALAYTLGDGRKVRTVFEAGSGVAIATEVWTLSPQAFGSFVSRIPSPLGIGTLSLADGTAPKGFLVEAEAICGAEDISAYGGWRAFIAAKAA